MDCQRNTYIWYIFLIALLPLALSVVNHSDLPKEKKQSFTKPSVVPSAIPYVYVCTIDGIKHNMAKKVRYYLERPTPGKMAGIYLRFEYKGVQVRASTQEFVLPEHWDKKTQRIQDRYCNQIGDYLDINRLLDELHSFVIFTYNDYRRKVRLTELTPVVLKGMILEKITGTTPELIEEESVMIFYQRYLFDRSRSHIKLQTVKGEAVTFRKFEAFSEAFPGTLLFSHVNLNLFTQFRDWLWKGGTSADSTVHKHLRRFKQMCLAAAANGKKMGCDVKAISMKAQLNLSSTPMDTIALNENDLATLKNLDLSAVPYKDRIRDLFLLGCYTGLRFNRWSAINKENVVVKGDVRMLQLFTTKGRRKAITLPLHPVLLEIFDKYDWELPKVPTGAVLNRYLKEICETAGFTDHIELARNIGGKSIIERYRRFELISTHTARRSFATNAHAAGIPLEDIQALTGHADRRILQHYIKEDGKDRAKRLSQSDWFTNKE
jgi:integrase